MRTLVVYESMFGNTHDIAEIIGDVLQERGQADVVPVSALAGDLVAAADLVVVGGPTHVHGLSTARSRQIAHEAAAQHGEPRDPDWPEPGLRDWMADLPHEHGKLAAAFDTRLDRNPIWTGRASRVISRRLNRHGFWMLVPPESFLVNADNDLLDGERERARLWAHELVSSSLAVDHQLGRV